MKKNLAGGFAVAVTAGAILLISQILPSTPKTMNQISISGAWTPYRISQIEPSESVPKFNLNLTQKQDKIDGDFFISPQGKEPVRRGKITGDLEGQQIQLQLAFNECDRTLAAVGYYIPPLQMGEVISMPKLWVTIRGEDCQGNELAWEGAMTKVMY